MAVTYLLLLSMTAIGCKCNSKWELYRKDPAFSNLMCPSEQVNFQSVTNNEIWCARECAEAPGCKSLIYLRGNKTCYRLKSVNPFGASLPLPGALFYKSDKAHTTPSTVATTTTETTTTTTTTPVTSMTDQGTAVVAGLEDSRFTASSTYSNYYAWKAKLNNPDSSWIPEFLNQWIQVDFGVNVLATHVITMGDPVYPYWVGQYRVITSSDCTTHDVVSDDQGNDKIFTGNVGIDAAVTNVLEPPVVCRCLRINPLSGNDDLIGLRFDVLVHTITAGAPLVAAIPDSQLTASSSAVGYEARHGRLNNTVSCWRRGVLDLNQAIQVDFIHQTLATHIVTKGNPDNTSWVVTYRVFTSTDCAIWKVVKDNVGSHKVSKNPSVQFNMDVTAA